MKLPRSQRKIPEGVIAIDFDGVIADSAIPSSKRALAAWAGIGGKIQYTREVERQFIDSRPLITKIEHYLTVLRLIQDNPNINFKAMKQGWMNAEIAKDSQNRDKSGFEKKYLESSPLLKIYPRIKRLIVMLKRKGHRVYIATTNSKKVVEETLQRHKIPIDSGLIFAKEISPEKGILLQKIAEHANVPIGKVALLDDAIEQLAAARKAGAKAVFVSWGYHAREHLKEVKMQRIRKIGRPGGPKKRDGRIIINAVRHGRLL